MRKLAFALLLTTALTSPAWADMYPDASNAKLPEAQQNLGISATLEGFGAVCDDVTDDGAAFLAANAWIAGGPGRVVNLPARTCLTTSTATVGNGRQQSTTLTAPASGTALQVASCAGIQIGDAVAIKRDAGTQQINRTVVSCIGTTLTISGAGYTGTTASAGNPVLTGIPSTWGGGGYRGQGGCQSGSIEAGISRIKWIGPASPTTTLTAGAATLAMSLTVASVADIALGDAIGVTLDDGSVFWTWAMATPVGTTLRIANELPSPAASGNQIKLEGNPVARVNGPIIGAKFEGVCFDAAGLAAVGFDVRHAKRGSFHGNGGTTVANYTGVGHYIHAGEFHAGISYGGGDSEFSPYSFSPANTKTIGCWLRGTPEEFNGDSVPVSRNRFYGSTCTSGGNDPRAAGWLLESADNSNFYKPYTPAIGSATAGKGLYLQPSINKVNFPLENSFYSAAFIGGVGVGTATGGTIGFNYLDAYNTSDGEEAPNDPHVHGTLATGAAFGTSRVPQAYLGGLALSRVGNSQISVAPGSATSSDGNVMLGLQTVCTASLATAGDKGLSPGSVRAADTWYAVFVVGHYPSGALSCMLVQTTAGVVPPWVPPVTPPFRFSRHVGWFLTDASSNIATISPIVPAGQAGLSLSVGAAGARLSVACGTNAGTAKLVATAGASTTPVTVLDNIGAGVGGC